MTKQISDYYLIMARSFINQFIMENKLLKKEHGLLHDLNNKLKNEICKIADCQSQLDDKARNGASFIMEKLERYVDILNPRKTTWTIEDGKPVKRVSDAEIEANNLVFGINFLFLLLEQNYFKGSNFMYFNRVCNDIYNKCEEHAIKPEIISNANKLIRLLDEEVTTGKVQNVVL